MLIVKDAQLPTHQEVKTIDYIKRSPDLKLKNQLKEFIKKYTNDHEIGIGTDAYLLYSDFIIQSYSYPRIKRYSISELSANFKQANFDKEIIQYLIVRYLDGMYLLAQFKSLENGFWP